jgi:hypothetical protein
MDQDLTFNSIVFKKLFDENGRSVRQSIARGVNTPDILTIQHQNYVDSVTKVPGRRHAVRFDQHHVDGEGKKYIISSYHIFQIPELASTEQIAASYNTSFGGFTSGGGDFLLESVVNDEL